MDFYCSPINDTGIRLPRLEFGREYRTVKVHSHQVKAKAVADLRGVLGTRGPGGPNSFNCMQFLVKFGEIVCWRPLEGWRPTSWKSWIRYWKAKIIFDISIFL